MNRTDVLAALASFQDNVMAVMPWSPLNLPAIMQWIRDDTVDKEVVNSLTVDLDSALESAQVWADRHRETAERVSNLVSGNRDLQAVIAEQAQRIADMHEALVLYRATLSLETNRALPDLQ